MEIRSSVHPDHAKGFDTKALRENFLVDNLFVPGEIVLVYTHIDRVIVGSIVPSAKTLSLSSGEELGVAKFFERREAGIINIGGAGTVTVDGKAYEIGPRDGLYIGRGTEKVDFASADKKNPAKFYMNCVPAHRSCPTRVVTQKDAKQVHLGTKAESNVRTIYQYVHPAVLESCQLVMGLTILEPENIWNTMPSHTHDRRMEVYLYFDIPDDAVVFHLIGEPGEDGHLVMRNEQAAIMPSWSIHSGVGTKSYTFIWGMAGENQEFTDMQHVAMKDLY